MQTLMSSSVIERCIVELASAVVSEAVHAKVSPPELMARECFVAEGGITFEVQTVRGPTTLRTFFMGIWKNGCIPLIEDLTNRRRFYLKSGDALHDQIESVLWCVKYDDRNVKSLHRSVVSVYF